MTNLGLCLPCNENHHERLAVVCIDAVPMCAQCARGNVEDQIRRFPHAGITGAEEDTLLPFVSEPRLTRRRALPPRAHDDIDKPAAGLVSVAPKMPSSTMRTFTIPRSAPIVRLVWQETARAFGMSEADLSRKDSAAMYVTARQVMIYLLRHYAPVSYADLGRLLHKHHTTIINAAEVAQRRHAEEPDFAAMVAEIWNHASRRQVPVEQRGADSLMSWAEAESIKRHNLHAAISEIKHMWSEVGAA